MEYRIFSIDYKPDEGYYAYITDTQYGHYLWKDLTINRLTGKKENMYKCGERPGYYKTPERAIAYIDAYLKRKNQMQFTIRQSINNPERGWYIVVNESKRGRSQFVWKDSELHVGTGWNSDCRTTGDGMGYYYNKETAECYLQKFKEKHNMENIEITVKVNGVATPLHKISEQTLLTVRENSKPKEVPVARVGDFPHYPYEKRLLLKVPDNINEYKNYVVAIDLKSGKIVGSKSIDSDEAMLANFYDNVQTIS